MKISNYRFILHLFKIGKSQYHRIASHNLQIVFIKNCSESFAYINFVLGSLHLPRLSMMWWLTPDWNISVVAPILGECRDNKVEFIPNFFISFLKPV